MTRREASLTLSCVTLSLLVTEIMLSAIFAVTLGELNTVTAIASALLGLAAGGIAVYSSPDRQVASGLIHAFLAVFIAATIASLLAIMNMPLTNGDFYYAPGLGLQILRISVYAVSILPFFLGGICINLLLLTRPESIGLLYGSDLAGAAAGCLASVLLLRPLGAPLAILWAAFPCLVLVCVAGLRRRCSAKWPLLAGTCFLLAAAGSRWQPGLLSVKKLYTLGRVDAPAYASFPVRPRDLEFEEWTPDAWTIMRGGQIPQQWQDFRGWGVSRRYRGPVPALKLINFNLRFTSFAAQFDGDFRKIGPWLDSDLISLHYLLGRPYRTVLNIGAGGGREVLNALHHGAKRVTAVDVSEATVNSIMKGSLSSFSGGLYLRPEVTALADEGRSFLERQPAKYDLIDMAVVGGAKLEKLDILRVDALFTREALQSYLRRLEPNGIFSYTMYTLRDDALARLMHGAATPAPYIPALKTLAGLRAALEKAVPGSKFSDHVLIAALPGIIDPSYDLVHIMVSLAPLTRQERAAYASRVQALGFKSYYPALSGENLYSRVIETTDLQALEDSLPFNAGPTTDDKPFDYALKGLDPRSLLAANPIASAAAAYLAASLLFLVGPLWLKTRAQGLRKPWPLLAFFCSIGCAYMMIEIAVLLKLQVYLGKPVYSLSVALFSFLLASSLGSLATSRLRADKAPPVGRIILALAVLGLAFCLVWPELLARTIAAPTAARALIAFAAVLPLAGAMGTLFPIGIKLLSREGTAFIPWAWALNGCFSVVGIFASRLSGLLWGFDYALKAGLLLYVLAWACLRFQVVSEFDL